MLLRKTQLHMFGMGIKRAAADPGTQEILVHSAFKVLISISSQKYL